MRTKHDGQIEALRAQKGICTIKQTGRIITQKELYA